jgi:Cu(I)/Ag(I) efflux system membrane fusion protein
LVIALVAVVGAGAGFAGYRLAQQGMQHTPAATAQPATAAQGERKVLYWYDPMVPQQKFDQPGKSPFMDMQLVPKYADEGGDSAGGAVAISPQVVQNLGIRTAEAKLGSLEPKLEAVGSVGWNERGVVVVQARSAGFVEKLYARTPLDPVAKGAPLVEIFFPEWAGAQEEYLLLRRQATPEAKPLADAARQRLVLLGMNAEDIGQVEREGTVLARFTLRAPISGVIAELNVREGMTVAAGAPLFRIVDLSSVWVSAEVPEAQAAWLVPGSRVEARVPAFPEQVFVGRVGAILPDVNVVTRTVRARIELANPGARLKPGMFATLSLSSGRAAQAVLVPSEAVIRTGERSLVLLMEAEGRFRRQDVEAGIEMGGSTEIRKGLKAGDKVVLSGQFLLDSEASLRAGLSRLEAPGPDKSGAVLHKGKGVVTGVSAPDGHLELKHEPIPSMKWGVMQMGFAVTDRKLLDGLRKGDVVEFDMRGTPNKEGDFVVEKVRKIAGGKP